MHILINSLLISLLIQLVFFAIAFANKTDKVTDFSYGLSFAILALVYFLGSDFSLARWLLLIMILAWSIRLASYLFIRILKIKKDSRFDDIRGSFLKFGGFWLLQAITVWVIASPAVVVLSSEQRLNLGLLSMLGLTVWLIGLTIETIADLQKFNFKNQPENKNRWTDIGLWRWSRHPNYFGEMLCWWGVYIFSLPFLSGWEYWLIISPLYITSILMFVSGIPPLEERYNQKFKNNKEYQQYKNSTSLLVPLPPKQN